jgi:serine/threonine protein kinase
MHLRRESSRTIITLSERELLGAGGEARIYALPQAAMLVAKVYHKPGKWRARKLAAMIANPPKDPMAGQGHTSIIWPVDLLRSIDAKGEIVGFLMPRVSRMRRVIDFYHPKTRREACPLFNYLYLHRTGRNLAAAIHALHARGYVVGDMNESNVLVSDTALVTLIDSDSFQVRDPRTGEFYRCNVGKPEFTPPELQGQVFAAVDRKAEHDLFGLAVIIFQLLMEGTHPFAGIFTGFGDPPSYEQRISSGHFTYGRGRVVPYRPMPTAPPFEILHPALRQLFVRCLRDGHNNPKVRPDAQAWVDALKAAEESLVICNINKQHRFGSHLQFCPWCQRANFLGGRDPFPSQQVVQRGQHLKPPPRQTPRVVKHLRSTPQPWKQTSTISRSAYPATPVSALGAAQTSIPPSPITVRLGGILRRLSALSGIVVLLFLFQFLRLFSCSSDPASRRNNGTAPTYPPRPGEKDLAGHNLVAVSPDGRVIAAGSSSGTVKLWNAKSGTFQAQMNGHSESISSIAFSSDGRLLASGSFDHTVRLWDVQSGESKFKIAAHQNKVSAVAFSPKGITLATGSYDHTIKLWDVRTGQLKRTFSNHDNPVLSVAFSPDGENLTSGSLDGTLSTYDLETGQLKDTFSRDAVEAPDKHFDQVTSVSYSPDGQSLVSSSYDGKLRVWNLENRRFKEPQQETTWYALAVAYSPDGKAIASGNTDGTVQLWSADSLQLLWSSQGHSTPITSVVFSPRADLVVSGTVDGTVKVWDGKTGLVKQTLRQ